MTATVSPKPAAKKSAASPLPWIIGGAAGVIVLALIIWLIASVFGNSEPRLNENTVVLAKYTQSPAFDKLEYDKQRQYYKVIDDRSAELDQSFKDHRLTEAEYRGALQAAWLGKHIKHLEK